MVGRKRQRSSRLRSAAPRGREQQARASLNPRTSLAPSAQGRAGVPTGSADSLLGAPVLTDPYFRLVCDKDFVSAMQTSDLRLHSRYGPSSHGKPGLAGIAGWVSKRLSALGRAGSALLSGEGRSSHPHARPREGAVGALAAVASTSHFCKMAKNHAYVFCSSSFKVSARIFFTSY